MVGNTVGSMVFICISEVDRANFDPIEGLGSRFGGMFEDQLICFRANNVPRIMVFVCCDEVRN